MTTGDYLAIAGLLGAFVGVPGGILVLMLKGLRSDYVAMSADMKVYRTETRAELNAVRERIAEVEQAKVDQKDWIRVATSQMNRMNRMSEQLSELSGKLDATMGVGAGIGRIAAAIERQGETKRD